MWRCVLFLLCAVTLSGQPLSVGVKAGVPLTDAFEFGSEGRFLRYFSKTKRYTAGPSVEVRLPLRLAVQVDFFYRRLNYDANVDLSTPSSGTRLMSASTRAKEWQFPVLLKYRLGLPRLGPYLFGGPSFNHVSGVSQSIDSTTHWSTDNFRFEPVFSSRNQAEFLLGMMF